MNGTSGHAWSSNNPAKGRPSILLSAREAADVALLDVLAVGRAGFRALAALEPRFGAFEAPLFGDAAAEKDPEMMSHGAAAELAATLRSFLGALAPFFPRVCALQPVFANENKTKTRPPPSHAAQRARPTLCRWLVLPGVPPSPSPLTRRQPPSALGR